MKTKDKESPKVSKDSKKKSKLPEDVQKALADWEEFEKTLEKKRKQELRDLRRKSKSTPTKVGDMQQKSKVGEQNGRKSSGRSNKALSASDTIEQIHQSPQRNETSSNQQLVNEERTENLENDKQKSEDGKVRQWKQRLNDTKNNKREDYVNFYKTIKKNQETGEQAEKKVDPRPDSFLHYYVALKSTSHHSF